MNLPDNIGVTLAPIYQKPLFPLKLKFIHPNSTNSADLQVIGTAFNGKDYAVKTLSDGNGFVPASELFCYELAIVLSIATPEWQLIEMNDGSLAFGSTWEGSATTLRQMTEALALFTGTPPVRDLQEFVSKVYALDLFINNVDRHFGNYLFRRSYNDVVIGLAFDFSRAWYAESPYGFTCLNKGCNTQVYNLYLRKFLQYDSSIAQTTMNEIAAIPKEIVDRIVRGIPPAWLDQLEVDKLLDWWGTAEFLDRINQLKAAI